MLEKREFDRNDFLWRLSTAITVVSGFFSIIVFLLLLINYLQIRSVDPVDNEMLTLMRQQYAAMPEQDEALAARIQQLDLINRKAFFTTQNHLRTGAVLLLIGVCVFLTAFKYMLRWRREKPALAETPTAELEFLAHAQSRQLIVWAGVGMLGLGLAATLLTESALVIADDLPPSATGETAPSGDVVAEATETPTVTAPTWDEMLVNWPSFRGPGATGVAHFTSAPDDWDTEAGTGIRWVTEVPMPGFNSPVVWGNRVFLSGATESEHVIYCFDTETGEILWQQNTGKVAGSPDEPPDVMEDTGFAAPSLVVHGDRLFAIFANGDLVSYDLEGTQQWGYNLGVPQNHYGHSSSLLAYGGLVYVQMDQSEGSRLIGIDIATGKESWSAKRDSISWASPLLARTANGPQLVLNAEETVDAYAPDTGAPLWSVECLGGEVAPSPAFANGVIFSANEYAVATAIQLGGTAEAATADILWQYEDYLPEVASPVGDGERFYYGTSAGDFVCLDAADGAELWVAEMESGFYSSPVLVGDKIYVLDNDGNMYIVAAAAEYHLLKTIPTGEKTFATPAYMDGRIYLRSEGKLYCIERPNA